jgi:hypothetical protein
MKNNRSGEVLQVFEESMQLPRIEGVVIGMVSSVGDDGSPTVQFPGNLSERPIVAQSTVQIMTANVGREVALIFVQSDPTKPLVVGFLQHPRSKESVLLDQIFTKGQKDVNVQVDGETLTFTANREIVFRCGDASITLTKAGKVLLRGKYLLSRSSGVNRIKGGSVQIN